MKKILFSILLLALLIPFSCKDEDLAPIATFDNVGKGAFPRKLSATSPAEYDIRNLSGSTFSYTVDFVDINKGDDVTKYDVYVSYKDNTGGTSTKAETLWKSFAASEFSPGEEGFKGITVSIPWTEISSFIGLSAADMEYGDKFNFRTTVLHKDGTEFSSVNTTPSIPGSLGGYFDFSITMTCPLGSLFTGNYAITYESDPTSALGAPFGATPGTIELKSTSTSTRTVALKDVAGKAVTMTLTFACDEIRMSKITTSKTCGQGKISITQVETTPFSFDSDGSFTLKLRDYASNGGCKDGDGNVVQPTPFNVVFTKQ